MAKKNVQAAEVQPVYPREYDFDQFVAYGQSVAEHLVEGVPWSFVFETFPVTHENNDTYIIANGSPHGVRFERGQVIHVSAPGAFTINTPLEAVSTGEKPVESVIDSKITEEGRRVVEETAQAVFQANFANGFDLPEIRAGVETLVESLKTQHGDNPHRLLALRHLKLAANELQAAEQG